MNLDRIDNLTPKYKSLIDNDLSVQERKVLIGIIKVADNKQFTFADIRSKVRITQNNHLAAVLTRLVKKGFLNKVERGVYEIPDKDLVNHVNARCLKRI